jgi:hypothetical protein
VSAIVSSPRQEYLERLRDLLPGREADRIVQEVDALLLDHADAARREDGVDATEAERRAVRALGEPEALADQLVAAPLRIDLATRRAFGRTVGLVFAGHLLLSIVLTAAGAEGAAIPGLLAPLPRTPFAALAAGVISLFLMDLGAVLAAFLAFGRRRHLHPPSAPRLQASARRGDSVVALILLGIVAALFHAPLRDTVFAIRRGGEVSPLFSPDLVGLLPLLDAVLGLHAVRHVLLLAKRRETGWAVVLDVVANLGLIVLLVWAAARKDLVRFPADIDRTTASVLTDLATRALLLVFVIAALFLAVRLVRRLWLLRRVAKI